MNMNMDYGILVIIYDYISILIMIKFTGQPQKLNKNSYLRPSLQKTSQVCANPIFKFKKK